MTCDIHAAGTIELYFYGELTPAERTTIAAHLKQCEECRSALEDLTVIRAALASRPDVATPPGADWSGFMHRLEQAIQAEGRDQRRAESERGRVLTMPLRRRLAPYLAIAAVLALITLSVVLVFRGRFQNGPGTAQGPSPDAAGVASPPAPQMDPALASLSGQHFERSKLVVLGLATRDAKADAGNWDYERGLASTLLGDTRLYRIAAEERGMNTLAGVMRDLELVLLQTSMSEQHDAASLEQLQRLIRRRDLITKMNVSYTAGP